MADTTQTITLDSTIKLLQGGVSMIDPEDAIRTIEMWQDQLKGTEFAETLGELKLAIDGGVRSGEISAIMSDLGSQTALAASSQSGEMSSKLQQLAELLSQVGK
jgi:hypothetical protein